MDNVKRKIRLSNNNNRLKSIREDIGHISQAKLSEIINIPLHKIRYAETGADKISQEIAKAISEKLDYNLAWILTGEGPMKKAKEHPSASFAAPKELTTTPAQEAPPEQSHYLTSAIPNFSIADDLMLAAKVLESKTHYATALHLNIRSFAGAVNDSMQLNGLVARVEELAKKFEELKAENGALKEKINTLAGRHGGCPPTDLGMEHAARTGTDDQAT